MKPTYIERLLSFREKLSFFPWNRYAKAYCTARGVCFRNIDSVLFFGQCWLYIDEKARVCVGDHFVCRSGPKYSFDNCSCSKIVVRSGANLAIGNNVGISNTLIHCSDSITIGDNVKIGGACMIFDSNFHSLDPEARRNPEKDIKGAKTAPIEIKNDSFIGARSTICKGVTIGERAIIQAGSVVTNDIPADCIAGGNPCVVIKYK